MKNARWILLGTASAARAGVLAPVELSAQRMRGWHRDGEPSSWPISPGQACGELQAYAASAPLVTLRQPHRFGEAAAPGDCEFWPADWYPPAFCALQLAERLLDPLPIGNCRLQTLQQYFHLPDRGTHSAGEAVQIMADLLARVLRPIAERQGLIRWDQLLRKAAEEWYPSRIAFGKYKDWSFREAANNLELRHWLEWLAGSSNSRSARIGQWYLRQLQSDVRPAFDSAAFILDPAHAPDEQSEKAPASGAREAGLELQRFRQLVAAARERLRENEKRCLAVRSQGQALHLALFSCLHGGYRLRDQLRQLAESRKRYMEVLVNGDLEEARQAELHLEAARLRTDREYQQAQTALENPEPEPAASRENEIANLWKQLVKRFHPDRFANLPERREVFEKLTSAANQAKDNADLLTLQEISADPDGFMLRRGWPSLELGDGQEVSRLQPLHENLQLRLFMAIEQLNRWRESPDYELCQLFEKRPGLLDELTGERNRQLGIEIADLEKQNHQLAEEIIGLAGQMPSGLH